MKNVRDARRLCFMQSAPDLPNDVVSMMTRAELDLLYSIARHYFAGEGEIIDAGIFMGASTHCFARGVEANRRISDEVRDRPGVVNSYELARVTGVMSASKRLSQKIGPAGSDFSPVLRELLSPLGDRVDLNVGDVCAATWPETPIEILFVDVAKTAGILDAINGTFLPHLIPARGLLIQQDYFWYLDWWINSFMARYDDHFTVVAREDGTCVFRLDSALPSTAFEPGAGTEFNPDETIDLLKLTAEQAGTIGQLMMADLLVINYCVSSDLPEQARTLMTEFDSVHGHIIPRMPTNSEVRRASAAADKLRAQI